MHLPKLEGETEYFLSQSDVLSFPGCSNFGKEMASSVDINSYWIYSLYFLCLAQ